MHQIKQLNIKTLKGLQTEVQSINRIALSVDCVIFGFDEDKLKAKMAAKKEAAVAKGPKAKSKFQERLEQMQKTQIEAQKNKKK